MFKQTLRIRHTSSHANIPSSPSTIGINHITNSYNSINIRNYHSNNSNQFIQSSFKLLENNNINNNSDNHHTTTDNNIKNKNIISIHDRPIWRVVRLDDNGNEFEMERNLTHQQAQDLAQEFTNRLHKQMYFSELIPEELNENLSEIRSNTRSSSSSVYRPSNTNYDKNYW